MDQLSKVLTGPAGRHTGSFLFVLMAIWQLGWPIMQPQAAEFVKKQVDERISKIEGNQKELQVLTRDQSVKIRDVQKDLEQVLDAQREGNKLLIDILRNVKQ